MADALEERRSELRRTSRPLSGDELEPSHLELERVATWCSQHHIEAESYGEGEALQAFEARVADLLGLGAARFMPSGSMAQPIAARIWSERVGVPKIGMHPTCHLELHEERGYQRLHGLSAVLVGGADGPMTLEDLDAASEPMSTLIIELPTRENGGQLAPWDDLVALCEAARERGIATHVDGARLWEASAGYERDLDEICALFDSAYVSFYKGIGALPGSMLAGPADFIDEAKLWQRRQGGNLFSLLPNWVSADMRLDEQLEKMPAYRDRARELGAALRGIDGLTINPVEPQVNMFHVFLQGDKEHLLLARDAVAAEHNLWLFGGLQQTVAPGICKFELGVGDVALGLSVAEVTTAFEALVAQS